MLVPDCPESPSHNVVVIGATSTFRCDVCGDLPEELQPSGMGKPKSLFLPDTSRSTHYSKVSEREYQRRVDALDESRTLREAADRLNLSIGALHEWIERNGEEREWKPGSVEEEEYDRRVSALDNSDNLAEAGGEVGLTKSGMRSWAKRNYDRYEERFGR